VVPIDELERYGKRSGGTRAIVLVVVGMAFGLVLYLALRPAGTRPVPDFELPLLHDGTMSSNEVSGSPLVVNFFARGVLSAARKRRFWRPPGGAIGATV
jgi:hypothetical protein